VIRQICSPYGMAYLKYLAAAVKIRPGLFPKAIKMALFGHHFYKITREIIAVDDFSASIEKIRSGIRGRIEHIRFNRVEDVIRDLFSLDMTVLEKRFVMNIQKKYKTIHHDFRSYIEEPMARLGDEIKVYMEMVVDSLRKKFEVGKPHMRAVREFKRYSREIKSGLKRKYRYINKDFRAYFKGLFVFYDANIDSLLRDLESRYGASD
jgi:hypothetical protein